MTEKKTKKFLTKEALKNPLNKVVVIGETGAKGFLDFIRTQGVIGLAVGLILGGAVTILVKSLVDNVILPPIGLLLGSGDGLKGLTWTIGKGNGGDPAVIYYGTFLNDFVNFIIIALVVYLVFQMLGLTKLDKKKD